MYGIPLLSSDFGFYVIQDFGVPPRERAAMLVFDSESLLELFSRWKIADLPPLEIFAIRTSAWAASRIIVQRCLSNTKFSREFSKENLQNYSLAPSIWLLLVWNRLPTNKRRSPPFSSKFDVEKYIYSIYNDFEHFTTLAEDEEINRNIFFYWLWGSSEYDCTVAL